VCAGEGGEEGAAAILRPLKTQHVTGEAAKELNENSGKTDADYFIPRSKIDKCTSVFLDDSLLI